MSGRNRHNKYRRSVYRKHNFGIIVLIAALSLVSFVIAFLIIGNILHSQSLDRNNDQNDTESTETTENIENGKKEPVKSINGHSFLLDADINKISQNLDNLSATEHRDISITLNTSDGILLYDSPVAKSISYNTVNSNISLEQVTAIAKEKEFYISGIFYVTAFKVEDDLLRSVELSRSAAIIAEALRAGVDDIVIIAQDLSNNNTDEVIRFVKSIKALSNKGMVGLTIPDDIFLIEDSKQTSEIISKLNNEIDFLAMDAIQTEGSDMAAYVDERLNSEKLYVHMYRLRILIPQASSDELQAKIIESVTSNGVTNWQIIN